jgi:hypothetical protein
VALIGVFAAYIELAPLIQVKVDPSLATGDPFEPAFIITNVGYLPLWRVGFWCNKNKKFIADESGPPQLTFENHANGEAGNNLLSESALWPQDSVVKTCTLDMRILKMHQIPGGSIDVNISYHPFASFLPWQIKAVRFTSRSDNNSVDTEPNHPSRDSMIFLCA